MSKCVHGVSFNSILECSSDVCLKCATIMDNLRKDQVIRKHQEQRMIDYLMGHSTADMKDIIDYWIGEEEEDGTA